MLYDARLTALDLVDAVVVIRRAGVDVFRFINGGRQVGLGGFLGQVGARDLNLQARLVGGSCYDVKVL